MPRALPPFRYWLTPPCHLAISNSRVTIYHFIEYILYHLLGIWQSNCWSFFCFCSSYKLYWLWFQEVSATLQPVWLVSALLDSSLCTIEGAAPWRSTVSALSAYCHSTHEILMQTLFLSSLLNPCPSPSKPKPNLEKKSQILVLIPKWTFRNFQLTGDSRHPLEVRPVCFFGWLATPLLATQTSLEVGPFHGSE